MKIIFLDTESTGLPQDYKAPMSDLMNWPRVISLAWELVDSETEKPESSTNVLIYPDGWVIPKEKFWIENGFDTDKSMEEGKKMDVVLDAFLEDFNKADLMVAHNMAFDYPILGAEMLRYRKRAARKLPQICTMVATIELCKIPFGGDHRPWKNKRGWKYPKLAELYKFLFKTELEGAHDAGNDVAGCRLCFFELVRRGIIELPKPVEI